MGKTLLNGNHNDAAEQDRPFLRGQAGRLSQKNIIDPGL
jgi:hypothetical protein